MLTGIERVLHGDVGSIQRVIDSLARKSLGVRYVDNDTELNKVQFGEIVIMQSSLGVKKLAVRTGVNEVFIIEEGAMGPTGPTGADGSATNTGATGPTGPAGSATTTAAGTTMLLCLSKCAPHYLPCTRRVIILLTTN